MNSGNETAATSRRVTFSYAAEEIPADEIVMEPSAIVKYLRIRNGDYSCRKAIFLVIDGARHEITMDALPERE